METYTSKTFTIELKTSAKPISYYENKIIDTCKTCGYDFVGFTGEWKGTKTKIVLRCDKGHEIKTAFEKFVKVGQRCGACRNMRMTEDDATRRILECCGDHKFIGFVDGYKNVTSKINCICPKGHHYTSRFSEFVNRGSRCIVCSGRYKPEMDELMERINSVKGDHEFIGFEGGEYKNNKTKLIMRCPNGHEYRTDCGIFITRGDRCRQCTGKHKKSFSEAVEQILNLKSGYKFVCFVGGKYKNIKTKMIMECPNGHWYKVSYSDFVHSGARCTQCGVKCGFDVNKKGKFYIQKIYKHDKPIAIKIGITNRSVEKRMHEHARYSNFDHVLAFVHEDTGNRILAMETKIKRHFAKELSFLSPDDFPDGFSETLDYKHLDDLMCIVNDEIK